MCEVKQVTSKMFLDMNEDLPEGEHDYKFVGKVGNFCPIIPGAGGGQLVRQSGDKYDGVVGTVGYRWLEAELVKEIGYKDKIDRSYYTKLCDTAHDAIAKYGDFNQFISEYDMSLPF